MTFQHPRLLGAGLIVLSVAASALALSGGAATAAPTPSAATVSASLIAALPAPRCPAGTTPLTPASASVSRHGADVYHYAMPDGGGFDAIVPPAGFRPATADNATLAEMNLPTRPARAADVSAWKAHLASYRGVEKPQLCQSAQPISRPARTAAPAAVHAAHASSYNWSGYVETQGGYTQVVSHWIQTSAHACGCTGPTDEVTWVGLGGWTTDRLLQDGTRNYSSNTPYAWYEYLGAVSVSILQGSPTTVGDTISASTAYSGGTATFGVTDNGVYKVNIKKSGLSGDYDGSAAEFINERPTYSGSNPYKPLTNYSTTTFSSARMYRGSSEIPFDGTPPTGVVMTDNGTYDAPPCSTSAHILAYPDNAVSGGFTSVWCRAA